MMMCDAVCACQCVLKSCALLAAKLLLLHHNLLQHSFISVSQSGLAARRRQELMTIWESWTKPCSCTWITAAMAPRIKNKGVSHGVHTFHHRPKVSTAVSVFFPPVLQGQTHASCDQHSSRPLSCSSYWRFLAAFSRSNSSV